MTARIVRGDVLGFARHYHGEPFHALLCDPPYHLNSIVKRFSRATPDDIEKNATNRKTANQGCSPFKRTATGFMGKRWDGGDLAFRPETWAALGALLHPGAFCMAFASSRGWHRMAVAIEDAGMVIHPSIFGWLYGSGFPKATRVKADGFDGHRYGLQALKPALEPIIVFQKPYQGRPVDSITRTGAGALNVDGGRIGTDQLSRDNAGYKRSGGILNKTDELREAWEGGTGRWPANFALACLPACNGTHAPGCPVAALDAQSGERPGSHDQHVTPRTHGGIFGEVGVYQGKGKNDTGTASRFFHRAAWELDHADPVLYQAKASRKERDAGLEGFERKRNDFQRETSGLNQDRPGREWRNPATPPRNPHPTVKPIALSRWLATLLLPPPEYAPRRLLVPFAGVGSEMIGAALAGWDCIVGVEGEADYAAIARARLAHWLAQPALELG
jgi:hypothetical protein